MHTVIKSGWSRSIRNAPRLFRPSALHHLLNCVLQLAATKTFLHRGLRAHRSQKHQRQRASPIRFAHAGSSYLLSSLLLSATVTRILVLADHSSDAAKSGRGSDQFWQPTAVGRFACRNSSLPSNHRGDNDNKIYHKFGLPRSRARTTFGISRSGPV